VVDRKFLHSEYSAYLRRLERADERTRTADLLITSLLKHVLARSGASGNCACLGAFRHAGANLVSVAYHLVPARLQYALG
jgi:hypothetical protein